MNYRKKKKEQSEDQKSFSEGFKYGRKKSQSEREDDYLESLGMKDGGISKAIDSDAEREFFKSHKKNGKLKYKGSKAIDSDAEREFFKSRRENNKLEDGGLAKKKLKKLAEKRMCPSCKKGKCGCK